MLTLFRLLRAGFHSVLLFVMPWAVGAITGFVFDIGEVQESEDSFARWFMLLALPLFVLQLAAIFVKIGREMRSLKAIGRTGFSEFVGALDKHVRVLTGRGVGLAFSSMIMVSLALSAKWAQLGTIAMAGLGAVYLFATLATLASAFSVRAFDDRVRRGRGSIDREVAPTVVDAGDPAEERFLLARVPVPPAFRLHISEELPHRLGGETRFVVDRSISRAEATVSAPLPRTARGLYRLGPATIWYEDVLGLTRVAVAAQACAILRVLPRLRPILFDKKPNAFARAEGPFSVLSRLPTDDYFRTREYVHGDDLRRVHWKLSVNSGKLHVRMPETVPFAPRKVRLVLDTYLPPSLARAVPTLGDALDLTVEAWIALAHALVARGEKVTLAAPVWDNRIGGIVVRELPCKRGEERVWRAIGSDAIWQSEWTVERTIRELKEGKDSQSQVVVSGGLGPLVVRGPETSLVLTDTVAMLQLEIKEPKESFVKRRLFHRYPIGAEDNGIDWQKLFADLGNKPYEANIWRDVRVTVEQMRAHAASQGHRILAVRRSGTALAMEAI